MKDMHAEAYKVNIVLDEALRPYMVQKRGVILFPLRDGAVITLEGKQYITIADLLDTVWDTMEARTSHHSQV
jgi:hypothetical protein